MQSFLHTSHFPNSIWGISLLISEKSNRLKTCQLSDVIDQASLLPLKGGEGGEGGEGGDSPQMEEELFSNIIRMLIFTPLFQPFKIIRVMIQFGYEPVNPYPVKGRNMLDHLMGRPESTCLYLPGIYGYARGVVKNHGRRCLFAALGPSLAQMTLTTVIEAGMSRRVDMFLAQLLDLDLQDKPRGFDLKHVLFSGLKANIMQASSLVFTYPLFVCENLSILRCIKGAPSVWIWSLFSEVWQEAGIRGFYSGLLAMLLYQMINVWCEEVLVEVLVFLMNKMNQNLDRNTGLDFTIAHLVVTSFTYPLFLISNLMTVNRCSVSKKNKFPALPVFPSWLACFKHMYTVGTWFRGSSVLQRRFLSVM